VYHFVGIGGLPQRIYNAAVGLFHVDVDVLSADGGTAERQTVLVDTGASYLSLPARVLDRLGYRAIGAQRVVFATGETAVWSVTEVRVRLEGRERTVLAFLAADHEPKLLGAQTLETFGLGVDPLGRRLVPVDAYLAPLGSAITLPSERPSAAPAPPGTPLLPCAARAGSCTALR
jgi:clan AA aspartic protease